MVTAAPSLRSRWFDGPHAAFRIVLLIALAIFAAAVAWDWHLPGLYMDAVNPEYIIPGMLDPSGAGNRPWILPGNLLAERFPLFTGSLYHGSTQLYFALPFLALFGTDVGVLRLVQGLVGVIILILAARLARGNAQGPRGALAAMAVALLAFDPSFVMALRTQAYSCIFPLMLLLASVSLLLDGRERARPMLRLIASGILFGLAVFSYFIFAFFGPVLAWLIVRARDDRAKRRRWQDLSVWVIACAAGWLPFVGGLLLLRWELGSVAALADWLQQHGKGLQVMGENVGAFGRLESVASDFWYVASGDWSRMTMLRQLGYGHLGAFKASVLVGLPLIAWWRFRSRPEHFVVALPMLLVASFLVCACFFGERLGGHHYTVLMPLLYIAFGGAATLLVSRPPHSRFALRSAIVAVLAASLGVANSQELRHLHRQLQATGGVGLYSDAIDRFAADVVEHDPDATVYFPDWGFVMPFMFITHAAVGVRDAVHPYRMHRQACAGKAQIVAFLGTDNAARIELIAQVSGLPAPPLRTWAQRDGTPVFQSARFAPRADCSDQPPEAAHSETPTIELTPNALYDCAFLGPAKVSARWDASVATAGRVSIYIQPAGAAATLWSSGEARGSDTTGTWATPGMTFSLRDESNGTILSEVVVADKGCPTQ